MSSRSAVRVVLASASPARLATLRAAGIDPEVVVSHVDEEAVGELAPADLATELARRKGTTVHERLADPDALVIGCDSVLELDGRPYGKPHDAQVARDRWRAMRGQRGVLHTGHHAAYGNRSVTRTAATTVHFAELTDAEIDTYVATGEPLEVAGAFTVDGLGGAFVDRIEGDHHNVVGISLPLLRSMVIELGLGWTDLWTPR